MLGIYVHIPFCEKKCNYCAFSSFVTDDSEKEKYLEKLKEEIADFAKKNGKRKVDTIYFGGGTPSILNQNQFSEIVKTIRDNFEIERDYEFTIECNPSSLDEEKLKTYKENGVNRVSLGVQSLNDENLKFLGRLHDSKIAIEKIKLAKEYFDNISVDVILGIKNDEKITEQLDELIKLDITHFSTYMLQVEEGTPLEKQVKENPNLIADEEECVRQYEETANYLEKNGFERYEVSNFAKKGYESRHNLKYWAGEEYIGFGLSAHSFMNDERWANSNTFSGYYRREIAMKEQLNPSAKIEEHIMLGLRCKLGVDKGYLKNLGYDITKNSLLTYFIEKKIIEERGERLYLNPKFYNINNFCIVSLFPEN